MKDLLTLLFILTALLASYGQDIYSTRKGSKLFPGHLDVVVTVDSTSLRYEVYNHWYARTYSQLRQMKIPIDSLKHFDQDNDSLSIKMLANKVKLTDIRHNLNKTVRHKNLCASIEDMRKISFAVDLALEHSKGPHTLYQYKDLKLTEDEFRKRVLENIHKREE